MFGWGGFVYLNFGLFGLIWCSVAVFSFLPGSVKPKGLHMLKYSEAQLFLEVLITAIRGACCVCTA